MTEPWVKMKRGLFYMPNDCGYTGIRDHAGRYTQAEALAETSCEGVTAMPLADAPEFSPACFDDVARAHLKRQLERVRKQYERSQRCWIEAAEIAIQKGDFRPLQRRIDASRTPFTATETI